MDRIVVLDFGSQTAQLIARRIREAGVFAVIMPGGRKVGEYVNSDTKGIVLSGSPYSVYGEDSPKVDPAILECGLPILGICYGFHQLVMLHGGCVTAGKTSEFGRARVTFAHTRTNRNGLFSEVSDGFMSWMSHGDSVTRLPSSFDSLAGSDNFVAAAGDLDKRLFGLQFHPEVSHCEYGSTILNQ